MKCRLNCGGYCRRQDGTCSAAACPLYRQSKRGFCWEKWLAASKRSATPLRSSPKSTVKQRRRLYSKQPSSTSVSLPLELPDAKLRDTALIDHCLSPEAPSTTNVSFFQFRCSLEPKIPGNLACLSRAIAKYFPNAVKEMGEPSALAVYGRISAILQNRSFPTTKPSSRTLLTSLLFSKLPGNLPAMGSLQHRNSKEPRRLKSLLQFVCCWII